MLLAADVPPLRADPVRREEVRVTWENHFGKVTLPPGTFRLDGHGKYGRTLVGDPVLWEPLLAKLGRVKPEIPAIVAEEYRCAHCGVAFFSYALPGTRVRLCSDQCLRDRRKVQQRQWCANHADQVAYYYRKVNTARSKRRAEARAGRVCETCGTSIEAAPVIEAVLLRPLPGAGAQSRGKNGDGSRYPDQR
jgi:hypothetical protein